MGENGEREGKRLGSFWFGGGERERAGGAGRLGRGRRGGVGATARRQRGWEEEEERNCWAWWADWPVRVRVRVFPFFLSFLFKNINKYIFK
jgi:hypothetical protein